MTIAHETGRVKSGDVSIFFRKLGSKGRTPILLIHGLSYFSWDWLEVARGLATDREVVAMDMRGFGESDWSPARDYSVPTMAQDIVNLVNHLGWNRVVVSGHSMGGRSATYVAAKHPNLVAGLVLVDYSPENAPAGADRVAKTVAGVPERFASIEEAMAYFNAPAQKLERYKHYLREVAGGYILKRDSYFRDQFKKVLEKGERAKLGVDMWQLLGEVSCPILSLRGENSDMYAPETMRKMQAVNPRMRILELAGGHNIAGDNPEGFVAAVRSFFATVEEKHAKAS